VLLLPGNLSGKGHHLEIETNRQDGRIVNEGYHARIESQSKPEALPAVGPVEGGNTMKRIVWIVVLSVLMGGAAQAQDFTLKSPDLGGQLSNNQVLAGFGCTGRNMSPALTWVNAPKNAKSFAVTVYDPDAPTGSGWWHWVIFNIPGNVHELKADAGNAGKNLAPAGSVQSVTDFGMPGYGGACPPAGDKPHRYIFTVYALDVAKLDVDATASPAMVGFNLHFHTIAKASLVAYYKR
jgi:Raf kinase inhibitor-like YbhB/YbcL family protein